MGRILTENLKKKLQTETKPLVRVALFLRKFAGGEGGVASLSLSLSRLHCQSASEIVKRRYHESYLV